MLHVPAPAGTSVISVPTTAGWRLVWGDGLLVYPRRMSPMRTSAIALVDALGFKGIEKTYDAQSAAAALKAARTIMAAGRDFLARGTTIPWQILGGFRWSSWPGFPTRSASLCSRPTRLLQRERTSSVRRSRRASSTQSAFAWVNCYGRPPSLRFPWPSGAW